MSAVELVGAATQAKRQHVAMFPLPDELWVGNRDIAAVAVEVGHRDEELERVGWRHQRLELLRLRSRPVHVRERPVHPLCDGVAFEHRFLDGAHEQQRHLQQRRQPARPAQQHLDVATLEPEIAQRVLGTVVRDRLGEVDAVDSARRRPGDDVDDDACADARGVAAGELREQLAVDPLACRCRRHVVVGKGGRLHETLQLLRRPVHVDRERGTTVEDDRKPKLADITGLGRAGLPKSQRSTSIICRSAAKTGSSLRVSDA